ncbi:MAG TPA: hypothetical protein VE093_16965 [Polyangiaceae bacterium]|nr:hypothetical protein [Polyangiaceae bacterium]
MANLRAFTDSEFLNNGPSSGRPSAPPGLVSMLLECDVEQLEEVRAVVAKLIDERAASLTVDDVRPRIMAAATSVNELRRGGGIVPLDELRRQLPAVPRPVFDQAVLDMEQRGQITLKPAQALRAQRAEHGIRSERGLLFFVIVQG